jgi:hypothetical protein
MLHKFKGCSTPDTPTEFKGCSAPDTPTEFKDEKTGFVCGYSTANTENDLSALNLHG